MTKAVELLEHAHGRAFIGDTGYDSEPLAKQIRAKGMKVVVSSHPTRKHKRRIDRRLYRKRYVVEVFFHNIKRCRAIATRFEKTARNYLALVQLACIWLWLSM
jgi:transposase